MRVVWCTPPARRSPASSSWNIGGDERRNVFAAFAESHIARRLRRIARRARMRPIRTIALTVMPASASAAAITRSSICNDAVGGFAVDRFCGGRGNLICCCGLLHFLSLRQRLVCRRSGGCRRLQRSAELLEALAAGASFHRIDDSGAGASTFGMAARGLFWTAGAGAAPTVCGSALAGGFGSVRACWETHSARASAIDLREIVVGACSGAGSAIGRRRRGRRSWRRRGARELVVGLVAFLAEIPALTLGGAIDAIVPMAARWGGALRRGQATVRGGLGHLDGGFRCCRQLLGPEDPSSWPDWPLPRPQPTGPGRISRNGSTFCIPGNSTQRNTTLDALNLVRHLGRNEPQFRSGWGIIGAYAQPHFEAV